LVSEESYELADADVLNLKHNSRRVDLKSIQTDRHKSNNSISW